MARKIFVSSDMGVDPKILDVAEADPIGALLWPWLLASLDDWGRGDADARTLKATLFPRNAAVSEEVIEDALASFAAVGLVQLYESGGRPIVSVPVDNWFRYQTHIKHEKREKDTSRYPAPTSAQMRDIAGDCATNPASLLLSTPRRAATGAQRLPANDRKALLRAVAELVAQRMGKTAESADKRNPAGWLAAAIAGIETDIGERCHVLISQHSDWTPLQLADALEPPKPSRMCGICNQENPVWCGDDCPLPPPAEGSLVDNVFEIGTIKKANAR